jgi:hypothetical protein
MRSMHFLIEPKPSSGTVVLGSSQPVTKIFIKNVPGGKGRPARKADILTPLCEPIIYRKRGSLDASQSMGPHGLLQE